MKNLPKSLLQMLIRQRIAPFGNLPDCIAKFLHITRRPPDKGKDPIKERPRQLSSSGCKALDRKCKEIIIWNHPDIKERR